MGERPNGPGSVRACVTAVRISLCVCRKRARTRLCARFIVRQQQDLLYARARELGIGVLLVYAVYARRVLVCDR